MLEPAPAVGIFVHREPTDLRRSFDSLAALVSEVLRQDPFSGHLFTFFNRKRDQFAFRIPFEEGDRPLRVASAARQDPCA